MKFDPPMARAISALVLVHTRRTQHGGEIEGAWSRSRSGICACCRSASARTSSSVTLTGARYMVRR